MFPSPGLAPGTLLAGTYRIVRLVGQGGMGEVYEAAHTRLAGRYAVKVLRGDLSARSDALARFQREAEVTSALRHPNIVQVMDFNVTPDGHQFLVMEFLEGRELADDLAAGKPLPMWRVLDVVAQVASALQAAHTKGIVHRDLKPANLFLVPIPGEERELVKVVDFGISKVREATTQITQEMTIMGTPRYMSPEQAQGRLDLIDHRTDQFALAAISYELLAGRAAFAGEVTTAVLYQIVNEMPGPLTQLNPGVNEAVDVVVRKGLAKRPADRYSSIREYANQLRDAAGLVLGWPAAVAKGPKGKTTAPTSTLPERERAGAGRAQKQGPSTTLREASGEAQPAGAPGPGPAPARRSPGRWVGLALFLAVVAAGGWWVGTRGVPQAWRPSGPARPAAADGAVRPGVAPAAGGPSVAPAPGGAPPPAVAPATAGAPPAARPEPASPAKTAEAAGTPPHARPAGKKKTRPPRRPAGAADRVRPPADPGEAPGEAPAAPAKPPEERSRRGKLILEL
jgi:eukaryotic-like serine/threonine-protein kinase